MTRMTVCDAMGYARQRGQLETYRGHEYKTNLLRKIALEIAVNDDFLDRTVECLEEVARTQRRRPHRRRQDLRRADGAGDSNQRRLPRQRRDLSGGMNVVLLSGDLMVRLARRRAAPRIAARIATRRRTAEQADRVLPRRTAADVVIVDLAMPIARRRRRSSSRLKPGRRRRPTIVAFGPHVHEERLAAAREAGCDEVVSRGQFFAQLDAILGRREYARRSRRQLRLAR